MPTVTTSSATKPYRTLALASPYTRGADVKAVQRALGVEADGVYGPITAYAAGNWKWQAGFPGGVGFLTITHQRHLLGQLKPTVKMQRRARLRRLRKRLTSPWVTKQTTQTTAERAVGIVEGWADEGTVEVPAFSNKVPKLIRLALGAKVPAGIANMGYAWCAFCVFLALLLAGNKTAVEGLVKWRFNALYCPEIWALAQAGKYGMRVVPASEARRGDAAIYGFGGSLPKHIEFVREKVVVPRPFKAAGGNTSPDNRGSQDNGGGVYKRERYLDDVIGFIRFGD